MIYTILLKFRFQSTKSDYYETRSERRVINGGSGGGALCEGVCEAGAPKTVALVVCPLKTNAGIY